MYSRETLALMEAAVDAIIVIDHRGIMTAVNEATRREFGYRTDELLGHNVTLLMTAPDREQHDAHIARYLATGVPNVIGIGREVTAQRKDGSLFRARLSVGRVPDTDPPRFVGLLRDVTAEREANAALALERDRANAYLELNDAILLRLDEHEVIREINARGAELLGAPREDILGQGWVRLMPGEDEKHRARLLLQSALASGSSREREFDAIDLGGAPRRIYWRCIALRGASGVPAGWLVSGTDVTERQRRDEDAARAQERITRVAKLASMGEMAAGMAHELNQPLTAIASYARACDHYLASTSPDLAEIQEAVREIGAEGLRAGRIIDRLRQLVRNDEQETFELVDVNAVLGELRPLFSADAREFATRLELAPGAGLPRVHASTIQLQQVLLNLARNAFEALAGTPPRERHVRLSTARTDADEVEIRVSDTGPGIPGEMADRLFHPFATTKRSGTGLGLAMSRTIVHAHGGNIAAEPLAPRGTCLVVRLPAAEDANE